MSDLLHVVREWLGSVVEDETVSVGQQVMFAGPKDDPTQVKAIRIVFHVIADDQDSLVAIGNRLLKDSMVANEGRDGTH